MSKYLKVQHRRAPLAAYIPQLCTPVHSAQKAGLLLDDCYQPTAALNMDNLGIAFAIRFFEGSEKLCTPDSLSFVNSHL
jgi:hypothetical protein